MRRGVVARVVAPRAIKVAEVSWLKVKVLPFLSAKAAVALFVWLNDLLVNAVESEGTSSLQALEETGEASTAQLGWLLLAYTYFLIGSRVLTVGSHYICEILWCCNSCMVLAGVGMITNRPLLVGTAICIVGADQLCWYVDLVGYLALRKFPIGAAKYMLDPSTTWVHFLTGFHHFWFLPVCFVALKGVGMPAYSYVFASLFATVMLVLSRLLVPYAVDEGDRIKVLNINLAYEFWKDIPVAFLHSFDHRHPTLYMPFLVLVGTAVVNVLPGVLLYSIAALVK